MSFNSPLTVKMHSKFFSWVFQLQVTWKLIVNTLKFERCSKQFFFRQNINPLKNYSRYCLFRKSPWNNGAIASKFFARIELSSHHLNTSSKNDVLKCWLLNSIHFLCINIFLPMVSKLASFALLVSNFHINSKGHT